jgi:predicted XRE-type DNA-binding protein
MEVQIFDDVFDALADTPAEAANMKARADLLSLLVGRVKSWNLPQGAAAARLGITRPSLERSYARQARQILARRPGQSRHPAGLVLEISVAAAV